jgi:hypothetical protein
MLQGMHLLRQHVIVSTRVHNQTARAATRPHRPSGQTGPDGGTTVTPANARQRPRAIGLTAQRTACL